MNCVNCDKPIKRGVYCSNKCQREHNRALLVDDWLNGLDCGYKKGVRLKSAIRKYVLEKAGYKCEECGWDKVNPVTGKSPLEIDHLDGDAANCQVDNLKVLCPNCHSLTPTWKALNKGKANKERLRYSRLMDP